MFYPQIYDHYDLIITIRRSKQRIAKKFNYAAA